MTEELQDTDNLDEPLIIMNSGSLGEFELSMQQFEKYVDSNITSDAEKMTLFLKCLEQSKDEKWISMLNNSFESFPEAIGFIKENSFRVENYLESRKADLNKSIQQNKWFTDRGFVFMDIAFPCLIQIDDCFLPVFVTCAHVTWEFEELRKEI